MIYNTLGKEYIMPLASPKIEELIDKSEKHHCPPGSASHICVKIKAVASLPSRFGDFQIVAFANDQDNKEHIALVHGDVNGQEDVPIRLHSECLTGDVMGSLRCDCRDQLEGSLKSIGKMKFGVVLYLRQEGRGIGLINKLKAYQLQDVGYDTVEANKILGFQDDERDYDIAAHMLKSLEIKSIKLMTNNPRKINDLKSHGVNITGRIPIEIKPNKFNKKYLETKRNKSGHLLSKEILEQTDDLTAKEVN